MRVDGSDFEMETPVIVNSLLCFVHNFHATCPHLSHLVAQTFPEKAIAEARDILASKLGALGAFPEREDIVACYESVMKRGCNVLFATTNLVELPLVLADRHSDADSDSASAASAKESSSSSPEMSNISVISESDAVAEEISKPLTVTSEDAMVDVESVEFAETPKDEDDALNQSYSVLDCSKQGGRRGCRRSLDATLQKLNEKRNVVEAPAWTKMTDYLKPSWQPALDSTAYFKMLHLMQNPQSSLFSLMGKLADNMGPKVPDHTTAEDKDDKMEDFDDLESSPSPSEGGSGETSADVSTCDASDANSYSQMILENSSDKPFVCQHSNCQKRFANKFLLKKHQFIHTGLRPHICPYCTKKFNRKDNLLRHKKTHLQNGLQSELARRSSLSETISGLFPQLTTQMQFPFTDALKLDAFRAFNVESNPMKLGTSPSLFDAKTISALLEKS